ncbi:protein phosphatase 1 regulatory subunit 12b [Plakobranchus ocellatus]|uniref:Protein phosphatase 1 regulatory subunit 12b n=1 Tax=Plakobranchus ocellatus TaxID=259542 RepID=A0AAV4B0N9_9GAST|nr:protein phosphatase 1 regulatory subunit 12b [Plakobranchus ocellatus]
MSDLALDWLRQGKEIRTMSESALDWLKQAKEIRTYSELALDWLRQEICFTWVWSILEGETLNFKEGKMELLKADNQRLKDENGALIRVISKLSK